MKKYILFIIMLIILICCGNEAPIINFPIYNILVYENGSLNMPNDGIFLSIYFILQDDNGIEDINNIKIIHMETEYTWKIPLSILKSPVVWQEKTYYGFPFLEFENGKSILTGEYLISVEDNGGNYAETVIFVEIEGLISSKPFEMPEINYKIVSENKNKEIKISGEKYNSCEIKYLNDPSFFNGGRRKYKHDQKKILNDGEPMPKNTKVSVRVNSDKDETFIYFLKTFKLDNK